MTGRNTQGTPTVPLAQYEGLQAQYEELRGRYETIITEYENLETAHRDLQVRYVESRNECSALDGIRNYGMSGPSPQIHSLPLR